MASPIRSPLEISAMTVAASNVLEKRDLLGSCRLSCQIAREGTMVVTSLLRVAASGAKRLGARTEDHITPEPEWI